MRKVTTSTLPPASPAPANLLNARGPAFGSMAIELVAALVRWRQARAVGRQRRRAMAQLEGLTDLELRDIGVSRSAIYWVVNHGSRRDS